MLGLLLACGPAPAVPPPAPPALIPGPELVGLCDASAAVVVGDWLVVADDEHNVLHVFAPDGTPASPIPLDLDTTSESDLEGMAVQGGRVWVIASHDSGKDNAPKASRQRLFGLRLEATDTGVTAVMTDGPATHLMQRDPPGEILAGTRGKTSKDPDGLSIEGLAAGPDGSLLVGFRAPVRGGRALVERLDDPVAMASGKDPTWTGPRWLDLGGRGIRSLEATESGWVGVAGLPDGGSDSKLFRWRAFDDEPELVDLDLGDLNPEGLVRWQGAWWLLSDDGSRKVGGRSCKDLPVSARRARTAHVAEI